MGYWNIAWLLGFIALVLIGCAVMVRLPHSQSS